MKTPSSLLPALMLAMTSGLAGAQVPEAAASAADVVVITATRHALALIDAPAAMSVVPRTTLEQLGADNLLEALRGETGITTFGRAIGGRRTLNVRGMESRHTLYLVDGRRIGASDSVIGHSDFQLGWVAMEEIERVELLRGPLSSLYGAEAMGGVLHIVTRPPAERLEGSAMLEGSVADSDGRGGDGHRAAARVSGALAEGLRMAVTGADSRRAAVASRADPRISELEGRHRHDGALRVSLDPAPNHRLELDWREGREERWGHAVERGGQRRVYFSDTDVQRSHGALAWHGEWAGLGAPGAEWRTRVQAYGSRVAMFNVRNNGVASLRPNILNDDVLEAELSGRPAAGHLLVAGVESRRERLGNQALPGGRAEADHRSAFAHDEWELGARSRSLVLTGGLRWDEHERFGHLWSPRLYAVWHPAARWTVKGGASRGFKPPTLKQVSPGYREDEGPFTYFSDPGLRPETNVSAELGVGWDSREFGVLAFVFDNRVKNLIVPRFIGTVAGRGQYVFANLDSARLRGLETSAQWRALGDWKGLTLGGSLQYLDAVDGQGQRLEKRPRLAAGLTIGYDQGPWHALARIDHVDGQLIASGVANQPPQPVPALTMVGMSAGWRLMPGLDLEAGVSNLTNVELADESPLYTWAEPPRTWRLTLRARW